MLFILLFLESLGTGELIVILLFVLFFFGSKKIPELARGLGKGMREMKDAVQGIEREIKEGADLEAEKKMIEDVKRDVKDGIDPDKEPR
jgi:sec-independent protein translocase protein TatA